MTITTHHLTLTLYPRHLHHHLNIAGLLLSRCTICGRYEVGVPLGACAVCGGRRRLATVGELFEGDDGGGGNEINQDAGGTRPPATDRHGAG